MAMAISKNYKALCVASDKLTSDRSFILEIVKKNAMIMLIIKSEVRFKYSLLYKSNYYKLQYNNLPQFSSSFAIWLRFSVSNFWPASRTAV